MQNVPMHRSVLIPLVVLTANFLVAQQSETTSPNPKTSGSPAGTRTSDPAKVATAIRDSYYHPDGMSGLSCTISVDWAASFIAMKLNPPTERMKALQGLDIRFQSVRGRSSNITFEWTSGALDNKQQFEDYLKLILNGFGKMYWSLAASAPIGSAFEISKIEPLPDGGATVYTASGSTSIVITVNAENTPTHYILDSPVLKGTIDLSYRPAPKPVPGDLRRISSVDVSEHIGTSIINGKLDLDYQAVDGFYVPGHVSYDFGGAYFLLMDFSSCSVSKGMIVDNIK